MSIGSRIREARKNKGITSSQLADIIGVKQPSISKYESDQIDVTIGTLTLIADALDVSVSWLVEEVDITVGSRIRDRRIRIGMTQEDLALKCGYDSRTTINKIESGARELPLSKLIPVCDALGVTPHWLIGYEERELSKKQKRR